MVERATRMVDPLSDRVALVTGASSGIGEATAHVLAADGADLALAARREERLASIAAEIRDATGAAVEVVPTDVSDPDAVRALVEATVDRLGCLDIAVCNAGLGFEKPVTELTDDEYRTVTGVNVDGTFYTARETIPHLVEAGGNLVFLGSMAGNHPRPAGPVYAATKWWVRGFARSLQASLGGEGVAVTCVNPTEVRTEFGSESGDAAADAFEPGSVTEPVEVADAIAYAVRQRPPNSLPTIDLYRRDKLTHF